MFGAFWIGDDLGAGLGAFGVMASLAALFYFGARRSETLAGIGGPGARRALGAIDVHATALAGLVLILVIIGAFLVEVAQGHDGSPYRRARRDRRPRLHPRSRLLRWRS
jgi:hypothetical protein